MKKILFIGDIVGKGGREVVKIMLPSLKEKYSPDLTIANGENSAGGAGINEKKYKELQDMGIDAITLGNHVWNNKEFVKDILNCKNAVRPANYPPGTPGPDKLIVNGIGIVNLMGRVFMKELDCPFRTADKIISELKNETKIIIVDIHAEATSEKSALGWYLDGQVSAVIGTHTHVQTSDERILPNGTAFITDAGMAGSMNSVIGVEIKPIINRFLTQMPARFEAVTDPPFIFNAVFLEIDESSGKTTKIERIKEIIG